MNALLTVAVFGILTYLAAAETCQENYDRRMAEAPRDPNGNLPLGFNVPTCLPDGSYAPAQCNFGGCSCVNALGEELVAFTRKSKDMNCKCIRQKHESKGLLGAEFNCDEVTGNFLPVQCKGSVCYCADIHGNQIGEGVPRQDSASLSC